jgi:hypothetical protein
MTASERPENRAPNPPAKKKRKRGAQPGNLNALKHGFYSHAFTSQEKDHLTQDLLGELQDEEKLLDVFMDRVFTSMEHEELDFDRRLAALRTFSLAIRSKAALQRSRKDIYAKLTSMEQAMQELKDIPPEED